MTIRTPEPSDSRRNIRSPRRGLVFPHGLIGTIGGSGKGMATTAPEPASAGFGVTTVIPSRPCVGCVPMVNRLRQRVDRGDQTLFDFIGQRHITRRREAAL